MDIFSLVVGPLQSNCYILGTEAALVVDPGGDSEKILTLIRSNNISVSGILLTHAHFDHISATSDIAENTGAKVYIHGLDEAGLRDGFLNLSRMIGCKVNTVRGDVILSEGDRVACDNLQLTILHTPGHTPGSICAYWQDGEESYLISGDTLFEGSYGRTDFPGGNPTYMANSLRRLDREIPRGTRVLPGHGTTFIKE